MHPKKTLATCLALMGLYAATSQADDSFPARARVTSVTPAFAAVSTPRQQCWNETTAASPGGGNTTGAVIGAITGGLLGSTLGKGNGKVAAGAVGAATGAVVGDRWNNGSAPQEVQRCRTVEETRQQQVGYDVTYVYQGRQFATRLPYDPGRWVNLRVNLQVPGAQGGASEGGSGEDNGVDGQ